MDIYSIIIFIYNIVVNSWLKSSKNIIVLFYTLYFICIVTKDEDSDALYSA